MLAYVQVSATSSTGAPTGSSTSNILATVEEEVMIDKTLSTIEIKRILEEFSNSVTVDNCESRNFFNMSGFF